jgi:hypothetical protein
MIRKGQLAWSRLKVGLLFLGTDGLLVVASISRVDHAEPE